MVAAMIHFVKIRYSNIAIVIPDRVASLATNWRSNPTYKSST